jgi:hypothetical protein
LGRIGDIITYVYLNRYRLACQYTISELAAEFDVDVSRLAGGLMSAYEFNYTLFRREALRWYVGFFRPLKKASEIQRELNISAKFLTTIYKEIGFRFEHGGDRRSDDFENGKIG